ncbi:MAG: hypothetical protein R3B36_24055, partial [Polyangiaceae bacterium]
MDESRDDAIRERLLARIDSNQAKKSWIKVKTLLTDFGFQASSRVRKTSLDKVLGKLDAWGIEYDPDGSLRAEDYVTIWRQAGKRSKSERPKSLPAPAPGTPYRAEFDPLHFAFKLEEEDAEDRARAHDIMA